MLDDVGGLLVVPATQDDAVPELRRRRDRQAFHITNVPSRTRSVGRFRGGSDDMISVSL
jgi:hypothetical protein